MIIFETGRAGTLTLAFEEGDIFINNVHHFDLEDEQAVVRRVTAYNKRARSNSTGRSVSFVAGDSNYLSQGEKASRVGIDGASYPSVAASGLHAARGRVWAPALRDTVELHQPEPTRIGTANNGDGDYYIIASRLDRMYSSLLPLQHTLVNIRSSTVGDVSSSIGTSANGSDHVAVGTIISIKKTVPPDQQVMPRWLAEHPILKQEFDRLAETVDLDSLDPFSALAATKSLIKKAGKNAERLIFKQDVSNPAVRMQLVLQFARALAEQNVKLLQ
jgi:hypothetical protein